MFSPAMYDVRYAVVGGGFAGVQAVRRILRDDPEAHVDLYDPGSTATMVPALPDIASGRIPRAALSRPHREIFDDRVEVIASSVLSVDPSDRSVEVAGGSRDYEAIVLAPGSEPVPPPAMLSALSVYTVHTLDAAVRFREALEQRLERDEPFTLLVVGAGYTGLETAIAFRLAVGDRPGISITVVDLAPDILPMLSPRARSRIRRYLERQQIDLRIGVGIERGTSGQVVLSDGTSVDDPVMCWAAGMRASAMDLGAEVSRTPDGRLEVDEHLNVLGSRGILAAGDMAALRRDGVLLRRAVNFAYYSGRRAGSNAVRFVRGHRQRRFRPVDLGWVLPLGGTSSGRALGIIPLGGKFGLRAHYLMCGLRHFGGGYGGSYLLTALNLRRRPDLPGASGS